MVILKRLKSMSNNLNLQQLDIAALVVEKQMRDCHYY